MKHTLSFDYAEKIMTEKGLEWLLSLRALYKGDINKIIEHMEKYNEKYRASEDYLKIQKKYDMKVTSPVVNLTLL